MYNVCRLLKYKVKYVHITFMSGTFKWVSLIRSCLEILLITSNAHPPNSNKETACNILSNYALYATSSLALL